MARFYFLARAARFRFTQVRPSDEPSLWVEGPTPLRVLITGAGLAAGYGVTRWDDSMAGALARRLSRETGRGVRVDVLAAPVLPSRRAVEHLGSNGAYTYDAVVFAPCYLEASFSGGTGMAREARSIRDHLLATGGSRLRRVVMLGVPRPVRYTRLNAAANDAATVTNRALRSGAAEDDRVRYLEPPSFTTIEGGAPFDRRYYTELGEQVAAELTTALRATHESAPAVDRRLRLGSPE